MRKSRKQKTIGQLKKDLWKVFSQLIKVRYSTDGIWTQCFTCERPLEIGTSGCHAGHFLVKSAYSYHYWNDNNVRPQCYNCNINKSGDTAVFQRNLELEIGRDAVNELIDTRHKTEKRNRAWYEDKLEQCKRELKEQLEVFNA